jgi:hypothetical protein
MSGEVKTATGSFTVSIDSPDSTLKWNVALFGPEGFFASWRGDRVGRQGGPGLDLSVRWRVTLFPFGAGRSRFGLWD